MVKVTLEDHNIPALNVIIEALTAMRDDPAADLFDSAYCDLIINDVATVLQQLEQQDC